jgi:hypothetical protein
MFVGLLGIEEIASNWRIPVRRLIVFVSIDVPCLWIREDLSGFNLASTAFASLKGI